MRAYLEAAAALRAGAIEPLAPFPKGAFLPPLGRLRLVEEPRPSPA